MAGENPLEKLKQDPKQMAKIGVLVVVVLLILYEVMGMFGGGSKAPTPTPASAAAASKMTAAAPSVAAPAPTAMTSAAPPSEPQVPSGQPEAVGNGAPQSSSGGANAELLKLQKDTEAKYLTAVNELQMLKVQQAIAETNQAIAIAKLATVTSEKNITDVLTKPSAASAESSYANSLVNPVASGQGLPNMSSGATIGPPKAPPPPVAAPDAQYILLSVSQQQGKWTAVMGLNNKLFTANIGDVLSDTSIVKGINKDGVTLERNKTLRVVHMSSMI